MQLTADFFQQTAKVFSVSELTRSIRGTLETKFAGSLGTRRNLKLQIAPERSSVFHAQRSTGTDLMRDLARHDAAAATTLGRWRTGPSLRHRHGFRSARTIPTQRSDLQPRGVGILQAKFEALKRKLEAEGLFAPERKRPLPKFPRRIGIVTSPSGAAIRDMLNVLRRRAPWLQILINPVRVQGTGAAQEIAVAIRELATPNEVFASCRSHRGHARGRQH